MPTYATVTGLVTLPGSNVGIRAKVTATPQTTSAALVLDDRVTWGPVVAETDDAGNLSMQIPLGGPAGLVWRFTAEPLIKYPGVSPWAIGVFEITASTTLRTLASTTVALQSVPASMNLNDQAIAGVLGTGSATDAELAATFVGATAIANAAVYGNDSTDATAHFQTLMDALAAAGGGTLFIPRGIYRITGPLQVPSGVTVRGEGVATIIKRMTYTGSAVIINAGYATTGNTDITISDLTVDADTATTNGIVFAGVKRGTIHNVRVKGTTGYGIWLWAAGETVSVQGVPTEQVTVSACHITETTDTGIETDYAIGCTITGNTIEGTAGRGLYAWNGSCDNVFSGNVIVGTGATPSITALQVSGKGQAVYTVQTARNTFQGNTGRNIRHGIKVTGASGNVPTDSQFVGNTLQTTQAVSNGVEADYVTRTLIQGNHFEGFGTPFRVAVASSGGTPGSVLDLTIANNRIYGGSTSYFYVLTSAQITGNLFTGQTNHIAQFYGCTGTAVNNNAFADAGTANTTAMIFNDQAGAPCSGNVVTGNRSVDTRATKWLGNVLTLVGGADYNIITGNSARGARAGGKGYQNAGTGVNNVIANNMDA